MADISQTAANVAKGAGAQTQIGIAGATIVAGDQVYLDPATGTLKLATAASLNGSTVVGVALCGGAAGQPIVYQTQGVINLGGTLVVGGVYVVSPNNAGGVAPYADLSTGNYVSILGLAISTSLLQMGINNSGIAHA
jgi:small ligand-binding sensory domain FIST